MVISAFYPARGGAENQALELSANLVERGIAVQVLTCAMEGSPESETYRGIRIHRRIRPLALGPLWGMTYRRDCRREILRLAPAYDIIHTHQAYLHTAVAAEVARREGKATVCKVVCGGEFNDFRRLERQRGAARLMSDIRETDRMIALSDAMIGEIEPFGFPRDRIVVIPNMIDISRWKPAGETREPDRLLYVGRLDVQKDLATLLRAFAKARDRRPNLKLSLVGEGPMRSDLEKLAASLELTDSVQFHGQVEDVRPFLHRASLLVSTSKSEGLSNALLEAMGAELPVLASDIPQNAEIVDPDRQSPGGGFTIGACGALAEVSSPDSFAEGIVSLLENPELTARLARAARERIEHTCGVEHVVDRYVELYEDLTSGKD